MEDLVKLWQKVLAYLATPEGKKIAQHSFAAAYWLAKKETETPIDDEIAKRLFLALDGDPAWIA